MENISNVEEMLVAEFTVKYALLEFMLVRRGFYFYKQEQKGKRIEGPDWSSYIKELVRNYPKFLEELLRNFSDFCENEPPGSLFLLPNGTFGFALSQREEDVVHARARGSLSLEKAGENIVNLLKNVRNNLLHGGKNIDDPALTESRIREVIPIVEDFLKQIKSTKISKVSSS